MRFIADGPSIPDALLEARDAGDVLFFCGAGVSLHKARLPDFAQLAWRVANDLGAGRHGPARHLLDASKPKEVGAKPLPFAVDRVFSLLQQEFDVDDVRYAVANALRVPDDVDLSPHHILLALARAGTGPARLVTTNFDLLFERANPEIRSSAPPHLPDPRRPKDFRGVVHLHGAVTADHAGAAHDEFVLSSAEFGHAYLSDGWATRYLQLLVQRFTIVFVGYSADDPPVQYLLEAMNRTSPGNERLFAFHAGTAEEAHEQWAHRGVTPIPFQGFDRLWATLEAWAKRAQNVEAWQRSVIDAGMKGPQACAPHERGMVAHLARTAAGTRFLAVSQPSLPAEWLFVFDRAMRYSRPLGFGADEKEVDAYEVLALDDDPAPEPAQTQNPFYRRPVPSTAWDAFVVSASDRQTLTSDASSQLVGQGAEVPGRLPARLGYLAGWFGQVAHQPAAVAWLAGKGGFHARVRQAIEWRLRQKPALFSPDVREAWSRLLVAGPKAGDDWQRGPGPDYSKAEWSPRLVRTAMGQYRPRIVAERGRAAPWFELREDAPVTELIQAEVEYPRPHLPFKVPAEHLSYATRLLRSHLELAVQLEQELKESSALFFDSVRPEDDGRPDEGAYKLTGLMATLANFAQKLAEHDAPAAQGEVASWSAWTDGVFVRLRIWAAGHANLMSVNDAAQCLLALRPEIFWSGGDERDLLCSIRDRWDEFSSAQRQGLEERLFAGVFPWFEGYADWAERIARARFNRIQWLMSEGVVLSEESEPQVAALRAAVPDWSEAETRHVARPRITKARWVGRDDSDDVLSGVPLADMVVAAEQLAGYDFDRGVERNPFAGLVRHRPATALRALVLAFGKGHDAPEAWSSLLYAQTQTPPTPRLGLQTARRLIALPFDPLNAIAYPVADWMLSLGHDIERADPVLWAQLWDALLAVIRQTLEDAEPAAHDWVTQAYARPVGKLTDWLFHHDSIEALKQGTGLPASWVARLESLLLLPTPHRCYAIALAAHHFIWLDHVDTAWATKWLLPWSEDAGAGGEAFWAGFLSAGMTPPPALFARMKARLLARAIDGPDTKRHPRILAGMLLAGWRGDAKDPSVGQAVTDAELREVLALGDDELRRHTLWQLARWAKDHPADWQDSVVPFLRQVWPLQRAVRSTASTSALVGLAFDVPEALFDGVVEAIERRLTPANGSVMLGLFEGDALPQFVQAHRAALVTLFWAILTEDAFDWPYQAGAFIAELERTMDADSPTHLAELVRRYHLAGMD